MVDPLDLHEEDMLVKVKEGVQFKHVDALLFVCCLCVSMVYRKRGIEPVLTSASDGTHQKGSLHYSGLAWDFRVWGLPDPGPTAKELQSCLARHSSYWQVVYGDADHLDHIHVEYDIPEPKPV